MASTSARLASRLLAAALLPLALAAALAALPAAIAHAAGLTGGVVAQAGDVTYVKYAYDEKKAVLKKSAGTLAAGDYEVVKGSTSELDVMWGEANKESWYVVDGDNVTIAGTVMCKGTVNLVLCDGCSLTASKSIEVNGSATLRVYGQEKDTGKLAAIGKARCAAIGAYLYSACGTIEIHGGSITATGGENCAGIGGSEYGSSGTVAVYGGAVTATGGKYGAGIGGGESGSSGTVTVYGGAVTATGGSDGAGIGGGRQSSGADVTIYGGTVMAIGVGNAEGIGYGYEGTASGNLTLKGSVRLVWRPSFLEWVEWDASSTGARPRYMSTAYTVTFNMNGHGTAPEAQLVRAGQAAEKPSDPTEAGYTFGGWFTDPECKSAYDFDSEVVAAVKLYAKWTGPAPSPIALARPVLNTIAKSSQRRFLAKWGAVADAQGYELQWRSRGGSWKTVRTGKTSATVGKAKPGKCYQFRVRAVSGSAAGDWSSLKSRWLKKVPALAGRAAGKGCVKVRWKAVAKATGGYVAYARYSKKGEVVAKARVGRGKTSAKISGLKRGKKVWVSVRPVKSAKGKRYAGVLRRAAKGVKVR